MTPCKHPLNYFKIFYFNSYKGTLTIIGDIPQQKFYTTIRSDTFCVFAFNKCFINVVLRINSNNFNDRVAFHLMFLSDEVSICQSQVCMLLLILVKIFCAVSLCSLYSTPRSSSTHFV